MTSPANYRVAVNSGVHIHPYGARRDLELSRWAAERHALLEAVRSSSARRIARIARPS